MRIVFIAALLSTLGFFQVAQAQQHLDPILIERPVVLEETSREPFRFGVFWNDFRSGFSGEDERGRSIVTSPTWRIRPSWTLSLDDHEVEWPLGYEDEYGIRYGARRPYRLDDEEADVAIIIRRHY